MKRLLLPLLAALALPTAVNTGDLGNADFNYENIPKKFKTEKYEKLSKQDSFDWHCGIRMVAREGVNRRRRVPCKIEFRDGKLIVDGSLGITPEQIIHWYSGVFIESQKPHQHIVEDLLIFYRDSDGIMKPAIFAASGSRESFSFYMRFLNWMSEG